MGGISIGICDHRWFCVRRIFSAIKGSSSAAFFELLGGFVRVSALKAKDVFNSLL